MTDPLQRGGNEPLSDKELREVAAQIAAAAISRVGDEANQRLLHYARRLLATIEAQALELQRLRNQPEGGR